MGGSFRARRGWVEEEGVIDPTNNGGLGGHSPNSSIFVGWRVGSIGDDDGPGNWRRARMIAPEAIVAMEPTRHPTKMEELGECPPDPPLLVGLMALPPPPGTTCSYWLFDCCVTGFGG